MDICEQKIPNAALLRKCFKYFHQLGNYNALKPLEVEVQGIKAVSIV